MQETCHLHILIILWPEEEPFSIGTNPLFTPQFELSQFTLAENLTLRFQIIHLPVPHNSWQLRKGIFKSHFVFKTQSLTMCAQYWQTSSISGPMIHLTSLAVSSGKNIHTNI